MRIFKNLEEIWKTWIEFGKKNSGNPDVNTVLIQCRLLTNSTQFTVLTTFFCAFASGMGVDLYRWSKPHISLFVRQALLWITCSVLHWRHVRMFNFNRQKLTFIFVLNRIALVSFKNNHIFTESLFVSQLWRVTFFFYGLIAEVLSLF